MAVWSTRQDRNDPAALIHSPKPDPFGRPQNPACGATAVGLRFFGSVAWDDVATTARCAACTAALQLPAAGP